MHAMMHFGDVMGAGGYCSFVGDARFDRQARLHDLAGIGLAGYRRYRGIFLDRLGAQKSALANVTPKFTVPFEDQQGLAQFATGNAKNIAKLTFRRKTTFLRSSALRQISLQLG